jgi:DNA-binding transcriptional MerR regulator
VAVYSISDIAELTGIRPTTLRAWEQRYDLVTPHRDAANARCYRDDDLRKIYTVALLNRHGHRISKIVAMSAAERNQKVAELSNLDVQAGVELDVLTLAVAELDAHRLELILDANIEQRGFEETMMQVVYPFLDKLGLLYFTGAVTPVQESFVSALIRQKILAATDALPTLSHQDVPTIALFLPTGERQELSMLFVQYLLRKRELDVIYLGTDIGAEALADICQLRPISYLLTQLSTTFVARPAEQLVDDILERCPDVTLILTGYQLNIHDFSNRPRVRPAVGLNDLLGLVETIRTTADRKTVAAR